jgi:DNA-binding XRE family transcriptional regulator
MSNRNVKRVDRTGKLTAADREKYRKIREQIEAEKPDIAKRRKEAERTGTPTGPGSLQDLFHLRNAVAALKAERERQQLSISEVSRATGIDSAAISRLETGANVNPTVATLTRYARALGKEIVIGLADQADAPAREPQSVR